jgi:RNA polymerase sigma-70 factor (ECF subfamily)
MDQDALAARFERHRPHLRAVAYQMLGSIAEAEDVVQETWLRLQRTDAAEIQKLEAWLTRVTARLCLDELGSARARRNRYVGEWLPEPLVDTAVTDDPVERVTLDESVSFALLVVLETLSPAQRTAFVLHDVFGLGFDEIASVVGRTPAAVRQLASRARRRVEERRPRFTTDSTAHRSAIEAFLAAARDGDLDGLMRVLDPDIVWRSDAGGASPAPRRPIRGADRVARMVRRQAPTYATHARLVKVNGAWGVVVTDKQQLLAVIGFSVADARVTEVDAVYNPAKLRHLDIEPAPPAP